MAKKQRRRRTADRKAAVLKEPPVFGPLNYKLMASGAGGVLFGLLLMAMFNAIDGFVPLYVSPLLMIGGFLLFGYGIIRKNPALHEDATA